MGLLRRLSVSLAAFVVASSAASLVAPAAHASSGSSFVAMINSARSSAGLRAYAVAGDLTAIAQGQAARMAQAQQLFHNPNLATQVTNWRYVGENVGYGPDVSTLMSAFMHSSPHRANILDHQFTQVGVGVVDANGTLWVSMVFRDPMHTSTSPPSTRPRSPSVSRSAPPSRPRAAARAAVHAHAVQTTPQARPQLPAGVVCSAGAAMVQRVLATAGIDHSARLVLRAQHLLVGFQCGSGLPLTGVMDPATVRALVR
jgi:Cysteine-rich secretory protein family